MAIDCHDQPYYVNDRPPEVKGSKKCRGTNYAYQHPLLDIVVQSQRFTLAILPVPSLVDANEPVKPVLKMMMPLVDIGAVLLDSGFYSVEVITDILELGLMFEMPAPRNERVKKNTSLSRGASATR